MRPKASAAIRRTMSRRRSSWKRASLSKRRFSSKLARRSRWIRGPGNIWNALNGGWRPEFSSRSEITRRRRYSRLGTYRALSYHPVVIGFLRFLGILNAGVWLGAAIFFTFGAGPALFSQETQNLLGPKNYPYFSGAIAQ